MTKTENINDIGEMIHEARSEQGITLKELAIASGVTISCISMIETGRRIPTIGLLDRIAANLGKQLSITFKSL